MANKKIDIEILAKRVELLEITVRELKSVEPEVLEERLKKIENSMYITKEMLTTTEVAEYLGVSQSQIYKLTMNMEIPHYKPKGKTIYFDRKEIVGCVLTTFLLKRKNLQKTDNMKGRKKNKTSIYTDVQLTVLLEKSEIVIDPSKCKQQNRINNGKRKKQ